MEFTNKTTMYLVDVAQLSQQEKEKLRERLCGASFTTSSFVQSGALKGFVVTWDSEPQIFLSIINSFPNSRHVDVSSWDLSNINYAFAVAFRND